MARFELHLGDCLAVLKPMPDSSVDAVVCDPPYGLSFMGRKWDYDVPSVEVWAECLRVLKPGGHLLAFAGTRTQHRMAVRIEDAGFEIRDMIAWVYGSGFPKSLDVSKAIDKINAESGRLHKFTAFMRTTGLTARQINEATGTCMGSHYLTDKTQPAIPTPALWCSLRPLCGDVPPWVDELVQRIAAEREVVGVQKGAMSGWDADGGTKFVDRDISLPATDAARQWQGWGTALKPALEPITVARKPFRGTVAENVLAHGTGAINIDGCRVPTDDNLNGGAYAKNATERDEMWGAEAGNSWVRGGAGEFMQPAGRWPANLIHDGSPEVLEQFPNSNGAGGSVPQTKVTGYGDGVVGTGRSDYLGGPRTKVDSGSGSAARFFYCAKASKADRNAGCEHLPLQVAGGMSGRRDGSMGSTTYNNNNTHPTVKPTDLMAYLCRLVTPPGGVVLDPFMGSGSTGKAAVLEGFHFIGIEREAEYLEIARARISAVAPEVLSADDLI